MDIPTCLQVGNACRYADASGVVHNAMITEIVSTLTRIVNLSYADGEYTAGNVFYSRDPAIERWGCADTGVPRTWGQTERI